MAKKAASKKVEIEAATEAAAAEAAAAEAAAEAAPAEEGAPEEAAEAAEAAPGKTVTFVLNEEEYAAEDDEEFEDDGEDDDVGDDLVNAVAQVGQLLVTEEGEAVSDILRGIMDALDKQNKILYRGLQLLEAKQARR